MPAVLSVVIETSAEAKHGQRRKRPMKINAVDETGLDALAKLLVNHLGPELREIFK